ncbi:Hypothetical_protein [Hexamita inflata]|uniref:Hypothetical_protein n=1 Tax=Hexamita inflata TaxID=28002 RepID=A0AA86VDM0_9EUKA|nr:Hypothetical protein HINF_LOCUS51213 [Hexamita inflata]
MQNDQQMEMISVIKCDSFDFNYSEHYSEADLVVMQLKVHNAVESILNIENVSKLAYPSNIYPKLIKFEHLHVSFQIARYLMFKMTHEQLSQIIPHEFLPKPRSQIPVSHKVNEYEQLPQVEIQSTINEKEEQARKEDLKQKRANRRTQYGNLQFQAVEQVDNTPQITPNIQKQQ